MTLSEALREVPIKPGEGSARVICEGEQNKGRCHKQQHGEGRHKDSRHRRTPFREMNSGRRAFATATAIYLPLPRDSRVPRIWPPPAHTISASASILPLTMVLSIGW